MKKHDVKAFLFARWISTCYADEKVDSRMRAISDPDFDISTASTLLNSADGKWWAGQLMYFNDIVYPNYKNNGSVKATQEFLRTSKT